MNARYFLFLTLIFSQLVFAKADPKPNPVPITPEIEQQAFLYAAMSSSAYSNQARHFPLQRLNWVKLGLDAKPLQDQAASTYSGKSGLAFDIWQHNDTKNLVVAYRGTDSKFDYPLANANLISIAYKSAKKKLRLFLKAHPTLKIQMVTGHSYGGGLAASMALEFGIDAIAFDASPRIYDGFGDKWLRHERKNGARSQRIHIYEDGEILMKFRAKSSKFYDVVQAEYVANYAFGKDADGKEISKHCGQCLAKAMIESVANAGNADAKALLEK